MRHVLLFLLAGGLTFGVASQIPRSPAFPGQPIAFSHRVHVTANLKCTDCHKGATTGVAATIPKLSVCMECHEEKAGDSTEEPKVRKFHERGEEVPWQPWTAIRLSRVMFSHRRHTAVAGFTCEHCHGDMGKRDVPPSQSTAPISMQWCIDCHRERGADTDCFACHR